MKTYAVVFTPRAKDQLGNLYAYIADRSGEARADNFVNGIVEHCLSLSTFPERGTRRDDIRTNMRIMGHTKRVTVAFSVEKPTSSVVVHGIFYGGQDFETDLCDENE